MELLSKSSPVELVTVPLSKICEQQNTCWSDLRLQIARETGEIAIGYRTVVDSDPFVALNPEAKVTLRPDDEIILLSRKSYR